MDAFYCHHFELPLPEGHRFPMSKYRLLHERVADASARLGIVLREPAPAGVEDLLRVHCPDYVRAMLAGEVEAAMMRRIGFPWSAAMVERSRRSVGGTIAALRAAIAGDGVAVNLAGGTHHAAHARGGGYCVFNDAVVAARHVRHHGLATRVLIVDLDVHQGDGSAALCAGDDDTFTFSMHAARNYPAVKPPSDLDVALPDGTGDAAYLDALARWLPEAIERARPEAAIYLAGADPFAGDRLGHLALSKPGLAQRDRLVLGRLAAAGLPVAVAMAGGYAEQVEDIVDIHFATVGIAAGIRPARSRAV
ncbi:histone deacetylase family protein [Pseudomarimonas salicorniae]|uniref:Histone deacetylase n=1 Tax=Pseudomarimonas salicorniae TaxID=2933270 RepID=A0ABT0GCG9_9GAMM|nr:histone deacetylase [Lysobacter sp. CAU 1642]MCK7592138.1 histone deacetylase [Lysobacter sp. CAU 1642]